jgi:CRP-like cAMP-binding protein
MVVSTGVLNKCKAFATLSDKSASRIIDVMTYKKLPLGTTICQQGNVANCMYVLMSGTCVVTIQNKKVGTLSELDVFGEAALFGTGTKRSATVTAASDVVEVLVLAGTALAELTESGDLDGTSVENIRQISKDRSRLNVRATISDPA